MQGPETSRPGKWQPTVRTGHFRRRVIIGLLVLLFLFVILLDGGFSWLFGAMGIGLDRSAREEVIATHDTQSELAGELSSYLNMLYAPDGVSFKGFKNTIQMLRNHREALLVYLVQSDYGYYSGNSDLIAEAEKDVKGLTPVSCVPAKDLANLVYERFGGNYAVTHRSTDRFSYLSKSRMYVTSYQTQMQTYDITVQSLTETANYYILVATARNGSASCSYRLTFAKREEGPPYLLTLRSN
ncbi:MAG: hypothetical protein IJR83_05305 [Clostridia bacterium]|nr:hypothetical protein [Clostridia bacterium]